MSVSLGELATQFGCELIGDPTTQVSNVASLHNAEPDSLTFLSSPSYAKQLPTTRAAAVVLRPSDAEHCSVAALLSDNPYATYARMAAVVLPQPTLPPGVHRSASISPTAKVADSAHIAANVVIGDHSRVGEHAVIGANCVIGPDCDVGEHTRLAANVTLDKRVQIGCRSIVHPGVVIGADGFGNAMTPEGWVKVPQVGGVRIGNDVEIGANTTIDCGAIGDTVIADGVRIDNLCMIAHNVSIGEHTAMAAMTGIAGSTTVGKRCLFAGKSGAVGHVTICDDVIVAAKTFATKDITEPGTYAASFPAEKSAAWAKQLARFRRLGVLADKVKKLQQ